MVAPGAAEARRYRAPIAAARHPDRSAPLLLLALTLAALGACTQTLPEPEPLAETATAPTAAVPAPEAPPPETLLGASREAVAERLGKPMFLMRAEASEIWQYRAQGCVLDLFLYEDAGDMRVTYIEARDLAGSAVAPADCLRAVHAAREPWTDAATTGT
jgi:hypothetical protein